MASVKVFTVASTSYREFPSKFNPSVVSKAWTATTDSGDRIDIGFHNTCPVEVGKTYEASVESTKYGLKVIKGTLQLATNPPAKAPETASEPFSGGTRYPGSGGRPFPVPKTSGELAIIRQNALTNAVSLVNGFLANAPESFKGVSLSERTDMVIEVAYKFADFSSGHREQKLADELVRNSKVATSVSALTAAIEASVKEE